MDGGELQLFFWEMIQPQQVQQQTRRMALVSNLVDCSSQIICRDRKRGEKEHLRGVQRNFCDQSAQIPLKRACLSDSNHTGKKRILHDKSQDVL